MTKTNETIREFIEIWEVEPYRGVLKIKHKYNG